jgi:hypothetical protein
MCIADATTTRIIKCVANPLKIHFEPFAWTCSVIKTVMIWSCGVTQGVGVFKAKRLYTQPTWRCCVIMLLTDEHSDGGTGHW